MLSAVFIKPPACTLLTLYARMSCHVLGLASLQLPH